MFMHFDKTVFYSQRELGVQLGWDWKQLKELSEHAGSFYAARDIQQGDKLRHIDVPREPLKTVQTRIAQMLQARIEFPATMLGGIKGGSVSRNARLHLGQPCVFNVDIRDCFPGIDNRKVFAVFRERLGFSDKISRVLTKLTTFQRRLPQGAPTSNILANLVLLPLHDEIQAVCRPLGVICSFWVDDITLSGEHVRKVIGEVLTLIQRHGFSVRASKVRLLARHKEAQKVTGAVVNGKHPSVERARRDKVRKRILHLSRCKNSSNLELESTRSSIAQIKSISKTHRPGNTAIGEDAVSTASSMKLPPSLQVDGFPPRSGTLVPRSLEDKYLVGDPLVKGGAIEVTREQLETFFAKDGFGAMEVYRP